MIIDLEITFADTEGNQYLYKYGTEVLVQRQSNKNVYQNINLDVKEIKDLKQTLRDQLKKLIKKDVKEV